MYIDKLDDIVNKYKNAYHRTIKMKVFDLESIIYIDFSEENNKEGPNFQVGDNVRISKNKNVFAKGNTPNRSEDVFVIKKVKNTIPWTYFIKDFNGKEVFGTFYEKQLQKTNQKKFTVQKVIKRKRGKLYIKWNSYDNSFNSWIDKEDII